MWFTDVVDIPDGVVEAGLNGSLVVFVGAGASIGPPSSLPTFEDLATEVATALRVGTYEPSVHRGPDVFFDRLELQGLDVRAQVIARLGDPSSTPNELHAAIIGLFTSAETLRVVTTNYDRHLTSAAEERFGVAPVVYRAPAVPLGRDFTGIVHLHGDLEGRSNDLILTSRDFGRAYLTDAWAARFLNELFQAYTTVFIGYSHQDVVMSYLAQGLRPGSRRFGFIDGAQNAELWRPLELNPVTYPYTADHAELTRAIEAWGDWARMGLLHHRSQVEVLAESGPPSTPRDTSYLEHIVAGDVTASYFAEYMSGTAWLDWITEREPFPSLFVGGIRLTTAGWRLARWFAHMVESDSEAALLIVQQHGGTLNEGTATCIALSLRRHRPDAKTLGRWIALLASNSGQDTDRELSVLLASFRWPDDREVALYLFGRLIERQQELRPTLHMTGNTPTSAVEFWVDRLRGEDHWLRRAWQIFFQPNLAKLASELALILERSLADTHRLLLMVGQASPQWDSLSFRRSAIEPDVQDNIAWPFFFVIDCLRDCLEALLAARPALGAALIERLESSEAPILRRIAVHGWTARTDVSPDEKISHLASSGMLFAFATKHEVYQFVASTVTDATETRGELLAAILAGPTGDDSLGEKIDQHLVLDLLTHIDAQAGEFPEAARALREFRLGHGQLVPSEHLGYDSWIGPAGFGTTFPIPVDELLQCATAQSITARLAEAQATDPNVLAWDFRLFDAIATAATQQPTWGLGILRDLLATANWSSRYWSYVLAGLSRVAAQLDDELTFSLISVFADVLGLMPDHPELGQLLRPVSEFLMFAVSRSTINPPILDGLEMLGARVTAGIRYGPSGDIAREPQGVHDRAYNNWTGWIARFWVNATSLHWQRDEATWSSLPSQTRDALEAILAAPDPLQVYGQSILAAKYDFLAAADEDWTVANLGPLFAWGADSERAARAWSSFVDGGTLNERVLRHLRGEFGGTSRALRGPVGIAFAECFAEVMVRSNADYISDGTLADFVASSDEEMRVAFAQRVGWWLVHRMTIDYSEEQWSRWISTYLTARLASQPRRLSPEEAAAMLDWIVASGSHFPEAVSLYVQSDARFAETYGFTNDLERHNVVEAHPADVAKLADFVVGNAREMYWCDQLGGLLTQLLERLTADSRPVLLRICESAARLSCGEAPRWRVMIEQRWPG
jgi:hypothetical protein